MEEEAEEEAGDGAAVGEDAGEGEEGTGREEAVVLVVVIPAL